MIALILSVFRYLHIRLLVSPFVYTSPTVIAHPPYIYICIGICIQCVICLVIGTFIMISILMRFASKINLRRKAKGARRAVALCKSALTEYLIPYPINILPVCNYSPLLNRMSGLHCLVSVRACVNLIARGYVCSEKEY